MKIDTNKKIIFFDTETTGNQDKDRLCQLAYKHPDQPTSEMYDELFKPPLPISIESQAVHHIRPKMVEDKPLFVDAPSYIEVSNLFQSHESVVVAHNAKFDIAMLKKEDIKPQNVIDTLRLVRHLDPEMKVPRHNLQYLRYLLNLDDDITESVQAHDAKGDVLVLEKLFDRQFKKLKEGEKLTDEETINRMIEISSKPSLIHKFTFGKYKDMTVEDVAKMDRGYLSWMLNQKKSSDQDEEDWIFTLQTYLN